jgi:hypothetical protein
MGRIFAFPAILELTINPHLQNWRSVRGCDRVCFLATRSNGDLLRNFTFIAFFGRPILGRSLRRDLGVTVAIG